MGWIPTMDRRNHSVTKHSRKKKKMEIYFISTDQIWTKTLVRIHPLGPTKRLCTQQSQSRYAKKARHQHTLLGTGLPLCPVPKWITIHDVAGERKVIFNINLLFCINSYIISALLGRVTPNGNCRFLIRCLHKQLRVLDCDIGATHPLLSHSPQFLDVLAYGDSPCFFCFLQWSTKHQ